MPFLLLWQPYSSSHIQPGTINYQGDGYTKKHKRRKRKTEELFAELEASVRALVLGEPALAPAADVRHARPATDIGLQPTLDRMAALASGYGDLAARLHRLQHDVAAYEARLREAEEDDDEVLMLL